MKIRSGFLAGCAVAVLSACGGGGGGGSNNPPVTPAPSALSYPAPPVYTVGTAITPLNPTVTGTVTSYTISPALPAGLTISATGGAISGTPTAVQAATNYTVTAANSGGATTATVAIRVNAVAPAISYPAASYSLTTQVPVTITPTATGGAVVTWSVSPALPAGLAISATTGVISGSPTGASAAATYTVTATNSGGSQTVDLGIEVRSGVVFDFGHTRSIDGIQYAGNRILSSDSARQVILWNAQTGENLLSANTGCDATCYQGSYLGSIAGNTVAIRTPAGFDIRAAANGALTAQIAAPSAYSNFWKLASDGSYLVLWSDTRLAVWTSGGTPLFTRNGDYYNSQIYAAPGELRIARGPAGAGVIETIAVPSGTSSVSAAFTGAFATWFGDGERFASVVGSTVFINTRLAVQESVISTPGVLGPQGYGSLFWTQASGRLWFYAVGGGAASVADYPLNTGSPTVILSGSTVAFPAPGTAGISIVDVSGTSPTKQDFPARDPRLWSFAALSPSEWVYGTSSGVMLGELSAATPQLYSYGRVVHTAGSAARFSAVTTSGYILNFDAASRTLENTIDFPSSKLQLSQDGTVLAAGNSNLQSSLRVYALPARMVITDVPTTLVGGAVPFDFDLSSAGDIVLQSSRTATTPYVYSHRLLRLDTAPATEEPLVNIQEPRARLSPSGTRIAASTNPDPTIGGNSSSTTNLYNNGVLTSAAFGWVIDWLDDSRVYLTSYFQPRGVPQYEATTIVSTTGQVVATPVLPEISEFQSLGNDLIYAGRTPSAIVRNSIFNATTGAVVWTSPNFDQDRDEPGAVAGNFVFFIKGSTLPAEPR